MGQENAPEEHARREMLSTGLECCEKKVLGWEMRGGNVGLSGDGQSDDLPQPFRTPSEDR